VQEAELQGTDEASRNDSLVNARSDGLHSDLDLGLKYAGDSFAEHGPILHIGKRTLFRA
jgi:hypothetical protein